jgi:hypothetical protein
MNLVIHRVKFIQKIYEAIEKKIFYNSLLRYGIQSYFKMAILGLTSSLSFSIEDQSHQINSLVTGFILLFLLTFPIFTFNFLKDNKSKLTTPEYTLRFNSLYLGLETDRSYTLLNTTLFLVRRFALASTIAFLGGF